MRILYNTLTKIYIFFGCCVKKIISERRTEAESNIKLTEMAQVRCQFRLGGESANKRR